jgi:hypothetical protein
MGDVDVLKDNNQAKKKGKKKKYFMDKFPIKITI